MAFLGTGALSFCCFTGKTFSAFLVFVAGCTVMIFPCDDLLRGGARPRLLLNKGDVERGRACFSKACLLLCLKMGKESDYKITWCGFLDGKWKEGLQ